MKKVINYTLIFVMVIGFGLIEEAGKVDGTPKLWYVVPCMILPGLVIFALMIAKHLKEQKLAKLAN